MLALFRLYLLEVLDVTIIAWGRGADKEGGVLETANGQMRSDIVYILDFVCDNSFRNACSQMGP